MPRPCEGDWIQIVAIDIGIAIPIAVLAFSVILGSLYASQQYMAAYAKAEYEQIRYLAASQAIAMLLGDGGAGSGMAIENVSRYYNISVEVTGLGNDSSCAVRYCRVIEVGGDAKLLVIG
jgi:hypothetical protein